MVDRGVDPDSAGEDFADPARDDALQCSCGHPRDVHRPDAGDEDVAARVDDLIPAAVDRSVQVDHDLVARLDGIVGAVRGTRSGK